MDRLNELKELRAELQTVSMLGPLPVDALVDAPCPFSKCRLQTAPVNRKWRTLKKDTK
jgi:hypothetical protein